MATNRNEISEKADAFARRGRIKKALSLYIKAGDESGAGTMYEQLGRNAEAVESYVRAGDFGKAAELLSQSGEHEKAAQMFAKSGAPLRAAESLLGAGKVIEAARMFERSGDVQEAARLYEEGGRFGMAAGLYEKGGQREKAIELYIKNNRKELAARLCAEGGELVRAAGLYNEMEAYGEAARCYLKAGNKREAIDAFVRAESYNDAVVLCEELELNEEAAKYCEAMGETERAVNLFVSAGKFGDAGRLYEQKGLQFQAARMYAKEKSTLVRAAEMFSQTLSVEPEWSYAATSAVWDIGLAETSGRVAIGLAGAEVVVLDRMGEFLWRFRIPLGVRCRSIAFTPDASRLAVGTESRSVYMLDASNRLLWKRELGGEVRGLAFADEGNMIVAGCTDGHIRVLDRDGKDLWTYQTEYKVWHLAVNDTKRLILAGSGDGQLYALDYDGQVVWKERTEDWIARVAISPNGQFGLIVLGQDKLRLYDLEDRRLLWERQHDAIVQDAGFWTDRYLIITTNNEALVWDFECNTLCLEPSGDRVMRARCSEDGQTVYLGHFEDGVKVIRLHDCVIRAARCYEEAKEYVSAASLYESKNELTSAAKMYAKANDFERAAGIADQLGNDEQAGEYYEKAGKFDQAAECFMKVNLVERAAACYNQAGHKSKAGELLAGIGDTVRAAELQLESGSFVAAGLLYQTAGALDEAQSALEKAVEAKKLTAEGAVALGRIYVSSNRLDEVIKLLQPFKKDETHHRDVAELLAECFVKKKQYNMGVDHYREALAGEEENVADNMETLYNLATAYEMGGQYTEAKEIFKKLLLVDYYYKDVTGRIERLNEMSSIFSSTDSGTMTVAGSMAGGHGGGGGGAGATVAQAKPKRYEVVRKLGEGGMGVVYEARDTKLDRVVALKVLPSRFSKVDELKTRFLREARAVAALSHPNVVSVYDIGEEWGESYIAMEFIEGGNLRDLLAKEKALSVDKAMELSRQIAEGLGAAHKTGIVHRDIKPENVMLTASDQVKIMDFGLARMDTATNLTQEGSVMGTWRYMAPEQVRGDKVFAPADVYAVGIMMYEMLAGAPPFVDGDLAYHQVNTTPPPLTEVAPETPVALSKVVAKCLEKKASDRYADAHDLYLALVTVIEGDNPTRVQTRS